MKKAIKSVISTKQFGYEEMLTDLVVKTCQITLNVNTKYPKLNLDSVRIAKLRGGNLSQSSVVKGMVILRDSEGKFEIFIYIYMFMYINVYACMYTCTL